jgi:hypothetical protein
MLSQVDSRKRSPDGTQELPKLASAETLHSTIVPIMDCTGQCDIVTALKRPGREYSRLDCEPNGGHNLCASTFEQ